MSKVKLGKPGPPKSSKLINNSVQQNARSVEPSQSSKEQQPPNAVPSDAKDKGRRRPRLMTHPLRLPKSSPSKTTSSKPSAKLPSSSSSSSSSATTQAVTTTTESFPAVDTPGSPSKMLSAVSAEMLNKIDGTSSPKYDGMRQSQFQVDLPTFESAGTDADTDDMAPAITRAMRSKSFSLSKSGRVKERKRRSMTVSNCFEGGADDLSF